MDVRAVCKFCGRRWLPPEGVSASVHYCPACTSERTQEAQLSARAAEKVNVRRGVYAVRVPKNLSA
jgi:hypothetical protein